jgi:carbonic anhydrase/acetyltransferase-like protein (isoleucine patch superfamily)
MYGQVKLFAVQPGAEIRLGAGTRLHGSCIHACASITIGMNCVVLEGGRIGTGAVVSAGSAVRADVPPYTIAAGNPARLVKFVDRQRSRSREGT